MKIPNKPTRLVLSLVLFGSFIFGLLGALVRPGALPGYLVMALYGLTQAFLVFLWYRFDAQERGFRRSRLLNIGMASISYVAIPYYLFRTRGLRGGLAGTGIFLALLLIASCLTVLGVTVGACFERNDSAEPVAVVTTSAPTKIEQAPGAAELNQQVERLLSGSLHYPSRARHNGRQGIAQVKVYFAGSGEISRVELLQSSGDPDLDTEAVAVWIRLKTEGARLQVPKELRTEESELAFELPVQFSLN